MSEMTAVNYGSAIEGNKAYLIDFDDGDKPVWIPKSQAKFNEFKGLYLTDFIIEQKSLEHCVIEDENTIVVDDF